LKFEMRLKQKMSIIGQRVVCHREERVLKRYGQSLRKEY